MKLKELKNLDKNDILKMLGIDTGITRAGMLWWVGVIVASAVAGGTAVLLLAPNSRRELEEKIGRRARETAGSVLTTARAKISDFQSERG